MRWAPLAASFLGHVALLSALAGAGSIDAPPAADPAVVAVRRVSNLPAPAGPRLLLEGLGAEAAARAHDEGVAVSLDSADPRFRPYLLGVKRRIGERWGEPDPGRAEAARGSLLVEFTLTRSGRLATTAVREPSGYPDLDRAALEALARAAPFEPLPAQIAGASLRIRARFIYD
jgi:TonB family protein